jgi:hypothetical protein
VKYEWLQSQEPMAAFLVEIETRVISPLPISNCQLPIYETAEAPMEIGNLQSAIFLIPLLRW